MAGSSIKEEEQEQWRLHWCLGCLQYVGVIPLATEARTGDMEARPEAMEARPGTIEALPVAVKALPGAMNAFS